MEREEGEWFIRVGRDNLNKNISVIGVGSRKRKIVNCLSNICLLLIIPLWSAEVTSPVREEEVTDL